LHRFRFIDRLGEGALVDKADGDRAARHCTSHALAKMQRRATLQCRVYGAILFQRGYLSNGLFPWRSKVVNHTTAIFRQLNKQRVAAHHDALEFSDHRIVTIVTADALTESVSV
jgi:hypothetical protein